MPIHRDRVRRLFILTPLILCALPGVARPCVAPGETWSIVHVWPPDGEPIPPEGGLVIVGRDEDSTGWRFLDAVRLEATVDGAPVEGQAKVGASDEEVIWRPAGGFVAGARYRLRAEIDDAYRGRPSGEVTGALEVEVERVAGPATYGGAAEVETAAAVAWTAPVEECIEETEIGACPGCREIQLIGQRNQLRVEVTLARPADPAAGGYLGGFRVARDRAGLADSGLTATRRFNDESAVHLRYDVYRLGAWGSDEVCLQPLLTTPSGETIEGDPTCIGITDETTNDEPADSPESDDAPQGRTRDSGCSVNGSAGTSPLLLGLLLAGLPRRRRR